MKTSSDTELDLLKKEYESNGFALRRNLFSAEEVEEIKNHFMELNKSGVSQSEAAAMDANDPLKLYPRVVHPHRWDELSFRYMLHPKVTSTVSCLLEGEALAVQTMFYYKPPGARGQALHQDQFYLMVQPGTCMAAWTAIDDCDAENGAMYVVPRTDESPLVCPDVADSGESFTSHFVPVPKGQKAELVKMKAGDTLFFNGALIHGSGPNRSKERFRRSFIAHYASGVAERISEFYRPAYHLDGREAGLLANTAGGPCGEVWQGAEH